MRPAFVAPLVAALVAGCAAVPESLDSSLLFRARPADPERLAKVALLDGVEEVRITAPDGVTLHGWLKRAPAAAKGERYPLVIVFAGVAREASWMLNWGEKPPGWGWLVVNYRGYGLSGGVPSESAIVEDAKRIFDYAASRPDVDATRIVVLGRSLGSYVAVKLAASRPLAGTILATPFDSIAAVAEGRYPFLPMGWLVGGRYDSAALAPAIRTPALFLLAGTDDVTPPQHGEALAKVWGGPKTLFTLAETGHRGVEWRKDYWTQIARFLGTLAPAQQRAASRPPQ
jgi:fermentation-respiration switch protein FrsA (DUF1100 family)